MEKVVLKSDEELMEILRIVSRQKPNLSFVKTSDSRLLLRIGNSGRPYWLVKGYDSKNDLATFLSQQELVKILAIIVK
jgi:hypothetical protein